MPCKNHSFLKSINDGNSNRFKSEKMIFFLKAYSSVIHQIYKHAIFYRFFIDRINSLQNILLLGLNFILFNKQFLL